MRSVVAVLLVAGLAGCGAEPAQLPPAAGPAPATTPAPTTTAPPATTTAPPKVLRILLTDDDGWDAGGITAMRSALVDAGCDVTLVAPDGNRSGSGASADGRTDLDEKEPGVYAVEGTPVDAVRAGLARVNTPDLVVSGANLGQNSGTGITGSGTVGAAVTAARAGIPAIAVSTHEGTGEDDTAATADYVARVIVALGPGLVPPGLVLNVNHPAGKADRVVVRDPLVVDLDGETMTVPTDGPDDDRDLLDDGTVTLTDLDADGRPGSPGTAADRVRGVAP